MSFVGENRRMGDMTDFVESGAFVNPDGSPTYDGAPFDASDPFNPWNLSVSGGGFHASGSGDGFYGTGATYQPNYTPSAIPLAGSGTLPPITDTTFAPPPLANYTPGLNAGTSVTSSGLPPAASVITPLTNSLTGLLQQFSTIFAPKPTNPTLLPSGVVAPKPATTAGMSTTTLLLLAGLGVGAVVLMGKRRS